MKLRLFFKSFNKNFLKIATQKIYKILNETNYKVTGIVALPIKIKKFCVLRSPHIDKDSREHFELRIYKQFIDIDTDSLLLLNLLLDIDFPAGLLCILKIIN